MRELLGEEWVGLKLGLPLPDTYDLGEIPVRRPDGSVRMPARPMHEMPPHSQYAMAALYRGRAYLIDMQPPAEIDEMVAKLRDREFDRMLAGATGAASDELTNKGRKPAPELGVASQPLVVGTDQRKEYSILGGWAKDSWFQTIGAFYARNSTTGDPLGTGTLISTRVVLTAAHVIAKDEGGIIGQRDVEFVPRSDGSGSSDGIFPWGVWGTTLNAVKFSPEYMQTGPDRCYKDTPTNDLKERCIKNDWALVEVTRPPEAAGHTYFMDYKEPANSNDLTTLKNRGYVSCAFSDPNAPPPPACQSRTLYGSNVYCQILARQGDEGKFTALFQHDCDASGGQSGSPLYQYSEGPRAKIAGIHILGCDRANLFCKFWGKGDQQNWMRAITPTMITQMNSFMSTRP